MKKFYMLCLTQEIASQFKKVGVQSVYTTELFCYNNVKEQGVL